MITSLAIPQSPGAISRDWWKNHALPVLDGMADAAEVEENRRRLAALGKYVKDREQRFELDAGRILAEMRIGEIISTTRGTSIQIPKQDGTRFRLLAKHRPLVLELLERRVASRRRILARIGRERDRAKIEGDWVKIRHGDFREVLTDLTGRVDAIITDPPYGKEYLGLYSDLSRIASDLLRPGGICAVMVGQSYLPAVIASLGEHLSYRWTLAFIGFGAAAAVYGARVQAYWKPILVYEKPPPNLDHRIGNDVIRSPGGDTDTGYHSWGQNEEGMLAIVERLTNPSDLIVDPFLGGGTTLLAAARAGTHAIGCDIDAAAIQVAQERLK